MIDGPEARRALAYAQRFGEPGHRDPAGVLIEQRYAGYTRENQETWRALHDEQMPFLEKAATSAWAEGVRALGLSGAAVPELAALDERLVARTGWRCRAVPGFLPPRAFFACLADRVFPTTVVVRPRDAIGYLPEPDIVHDALGHLPLLVDPTYADFLHAWGRLALASRSRAATERLTRLFWYTVEFGLIRATDGVALYGAGLLSSPGEGRHALRAGDVERRPFDLEAASSTDFDIDHYQPLLFVLDDFEQLRAAIGACARWLG